MPLPGGGALCLRHVWQPFSETAADAAVGANLRGALYGLYHRHLHRVVVNVSNVGWSRIVTDPICEDGAVCPVALLIGTSQLPQTLGKSTCTSPSRSRKPPSLSALLLLLFCVT